MSIKKVNIPIDSIINLLKNLNAKERDKVFEKVFVEEDIEPLSIEEREAVVKAEREFREGKTIKWPFGR